MALNTWWDSDPTQRFWMEITGRDVLGENLLAPKTDGAGNAQWSYSLVAHVRPGDRILHYRTNESGGAAIVGWSEAVDDPSTGTITWQARGTRGRARGHATTGPSWFVPLAGYHELDDPVRGRDLSSRSRGLFRIRDQLEKTHGKPVYFPFFQYRPGEVRAQQGYLVKFPAEVIDLLPALAAVRSGESPRASDDVEEEQVLGRGQVPRGTVTRIQDPALRKAIEEHAVRRAIQSYKREGATNIEELGKPYDLKLVLAGEERHVEVKGSSLPLQTVELTVNEVVHAEDFQPTDLIVVDQIEWQRAPDGNITTSGGQLRIWRDWAPRDEDLTARRFAYVLPPR